MKKFFIFVLFSTFALAENFSVSTTAELRHALKIVADNNDSDTIVLQEGFYSVVDDGIGQLDFNSTEDYNLTLVGDGNVTLSGYELSRVFYINTNGGVIFSNLNFVDGFTTGYGGAIYIAKSKDIEIWDSNFSNNKANSGGAIYNVGTEKEYISGYYDENGNYVYGYWTYHSLKIFDSTFTSNSSDDGGAISGDNNEITNSSFTSNSSYFEGAISGDNR